MKHQIKVFSAAGDTALAEWEVGDVESEQLARGVFDAAIADGFGAVTPTPTGASRLDKFSPEVAEVILLRPIAGG